MMWHPLSMFTEKDGSEKPFFSMTRVVAFLFAVTICYATVLYARAGKNIEWPFCALGITTLMAVPLQMLFKYLQQWFTSSPGQKLIGQLRDKVSDTRLGGSGASTTVTTKVEDKNDHPSRAE